MVLQSLKKGAANGIKSTLFLAKIMLPVYMLTAFLKYIGVLYTLSSFFTPLMNFFALPGEAAVILVLGNVLNIYAALGAAAAVELSSFQMTVIAVMLSFSHSLFLETAVADALKVKPVMIVLLRLSVSLAAGFLTAFLGGVFF